MTKGGSRKLDDWITSFMEYTEVIPSPEIYRRWTAHNIIAGALERRAWTRVSGQLLYPNMLTLLVGPPGVGKTMAVKEAQALWSATGLFNLAPSGMTKAAFVDQLGVKGRTFEYDGKTQFYNPMLVAATEFGTLLPDYDTKFLNVVNDIYDCLPFFEDMTRGGGLIHIDRPHVNMISGTQPQYLGDILPESAYGMGFMTRLIMVYAGERIVLDMFKMAERSEELRINLTGDLITIGKLAGEFDWVKEAEALVEDWNRNVDDDSPTHPKLQNYNTRRIIHALKLAMVMSISRSNDFIVSFEDIKRSREMLVEAEELMPEIFKEMSTSQDGSEIKEIHMYLFSYCDKYKVELVPEHKLIHFMAQRVAVNKIKYFIDTMEASGLMKVDGLNIAGQRKFRPLRTSLHGR